MSTIRNTGSVRTTAPTTSTRAPASPQTAPTAQQPAATGHSGSSSFQAASSPELTREEKKQILSDAFGQLRGQIEERYKKDGSYRTKQVAEKMIAKFEEEILSGKKPLTEESLKKGFTEIFTGSSIIGKGRDSMWKMVFNQIMEQFQKPVKWE